MPHRNDERRNDDRRDRAPDPGHWPGYVDDVRDGGYPDWHLEPWHGAENWDRRRRHRDDPSRPRR